MNILVTGGAGYIGSHTCVELLVAGHTVTIFDNFQNSTLNCVARIAEISKQAPRIIRGDVRDSEALVKALNDNATDAVIHFAGLKAVGESVEKPLAYYDNNVVGTMRLLEAMSMAGTRKLLFSSSATVYGNPLYLPITESHPLSTTNPYGRGKLVVEDVLRDLQSADSSWQIGILRYFNPVGAHPTGLIGENPLGIPNNLMPFVAQVAYGLRDQLTVWGNDYDTPDGTGVRDYIHVVDLALGHVAALNYLTETPKCLFATNLGTGRGHSVLEMIRTFARISGRNVPLVIGPRREGDVASCYADPRLAEQLFDWRASRSIDEMCEDAWNWQCMLSKLVSY
jgi:UDP-glucose 4-epimerase